MFVATLRLLLHLTKMVSVLHVYPLDRLLSFGDFDTLTGARRWPTFCHCAREWPRMNATAQK